MGWTVCAAFVAAPRPDPPRGLYARGLNASIDSPRGTPEHEETMNQLTIANEYSGLIRQELDIESLLRTTLEFVLARVGPTNAAVFLPTTSGDYSLGAYVNCDCPKETVDVMLDHLANAVAPKFDRETQIVWMPDRPSLLSRIGDDAGWLGDSGVIAFACRHDKECLAVFLLFREPKTPYPASLLPQLKTIGDIFGAQLARVIRIHHRHIPKDKWGAIGDTPDEDSDADDIGGMAA